jgi:hypothetical protein
MQQPPGALGQPDLHLPQSCRRKHRTGVADPPPRAMAAGARGQRSGTLPFVRGVLELRAQVQLAEMLIDRLSEGSPVAQPRFVGPPASGARYGAQPPWQIAR